MNKVMRPVMAVLAGTLALLVWGMVFWGWLAGPLGMFHALPMAGNVTRLFQQENMPTGTYFVPWPRDTKETFEKFVEHHKQGSFYKLSYIREGVDPQSPGKFLWGALHHMLVSVLAVLILSMSKVRYYFHRVIIVVLAGMIGTLYITIADPIWFHLPWDYPMGAVVYETVSWVLLAVVTAVVLKLDKA